MSSAQTMRNPQHAGTARNESAPMEQRAVDVKEDLVEYLTCYAKQNPAHAALVCLGVGFVLGWKLKPW
jgi:hypothetical protein